ncbi:MAG: Do family serine endopeptidase [Alphaproteobacteria bacterium]|nr:Do family serine endopeptidase [Alphaproteobacteria bacterium]MDA8004373.1 Do family serine endopeptidase [Alphaproteobacteria bacterium]MDA8006290.1 Do family serine endopeptidase [Alphaproteobacteria bacterium]MDA8013635.1 Do family serine endopeptidase [Alphaproteobacteria bacterium]
MNSQRDALTDESHARTTVVRKTAIRTFTVIAALLALAAFQAPSLSPLSAANAQETIDWSDLVEEVGGAVVQINAEVIFDEDTPSRSDDLDAMRRFFRDRGLLFPFEDDFFMPFDDNRGRRQGRRENPFEDNSVRPQSSGSGFVIQTDDGEQRIVTNHHVVARADIVTVRLSDDREYPAELIGSDAETDLALLRFADDAPPPDGLQSVDLGDSDDIRVGSPVLAVGNPFGLGGTVTAGIVSARERRLGSSVFVDFFQTDAAINPGNSGGPLFNAEGRVVGVNTAIFTRSGAWAGIGFAIPSNVAREIIARLESDGAVERGWLGVRYQAVTEELAAGLGLDEPRGALVSEVLEDTPADEADIRAGDVVLRFGVKRIQEHDDLIAAVASLAPGEEASLDLWRDGEVLTTEVSLGLRPGADDDDGELRGRAEPSEEQESLRNVGLRVRVLDDELRALLRLGADVEGLAILAVRPGSAAARAGLASRDVLLQIDEDIPSDVQDLARAIQDRDEDIPVVLRVLRGEARFFTTLEISRG